MKRCIADPWTRSAAGFQIIGFGDISRTLFDRYTELASIHNYRLVSMRSDSNTVSMSTTIYTAIALLAAFGIAAIFYIRQRGLRATPRQLIPGSPLPDFQATDEQGNPVYSVGLHGSPTVILFVRGNWCPFCSRQVSNLTQHYRDIVGLGAKLILITPKPLETTRRVAEFFNVEFDFWLDDELTLTRQLGLLQEGGVPGSYNKEYGKDTVWPTALVVDGAGIISYTALSKHISDRPDPELLLREVRKTIKT
jgi:peroxiredoxin